MHVTIESPQPGITVLRLAGGLEMQNVSTFRQTLQTEVRRAQRGLIVLLAEVPFIDSAGIAVLIEGLKWSHARSLPYILAQLPSAVQMVIQLARLENFFTVAHSLEDATTMILQTS
ncbi:MAG TPA: STAS domain-containing protein [Candidatus Tectomicrobia bacterium]|jgi:anti-anti-sigma factor